MSNEPIDHHYLPQFYLKNFAFTIKKKNYRLYVYDKIHEKKIVPKTTKEICYEKHRNTLDIYGEKDYFIEKSFSELEGVMAEFLRLTLEYEKIIHDESIKSKSILDKNKFLPYSYKINLKKLLDIRYYARIFNYIISVFYWRLTIHDDYFIKNNRRNLLSESISNLLKGNKNDLADIDYISYLLAEMRKEFVPFECLINNDATIKLYKSFIHPVKNLFKNTQKKNLFLLRTINYIISSDVPFYLFDDRLSLDDRFIFIWSPNIIFINNIKIGTINTQDLCFKLSLLSYLSAKKYVFSNDKKLLHNVICYANMKYSNNDTNQLQQEILSTLRGEINQ